MSISACYLAPPLPEGLEGLAELALDLRWSWSHTADLLWERISPDVWELTRNPWLVLQTASGSRLEELARDAGFCRMVDDHLSHRKETLGALTWFGQAYLGRGLSVAYFSMEFGLSEALPIYSGGLGILAGDHLKTASDLGVPLVGVGLLYQQGYFRQALDARGGQMEFYPYNDPSQLPILPVRDTQGEWLKVEVELPGRRVRLRAWAARVGRVTLYLLDSNDPLNTPADRSITSELYGGGSELRLQQEMVLGLGGWRLLKALDIRAEVCHLNEGHAAFAILERARTFMVETGERFSVALAATRSGNVFTTHTPVDAGFDRFSPALASHYLGMVAGALGLDLKDLLALGRRDPWNEAEPFNMAYLAVRGSGRVNGVSRLHGEVSRRIFQPLFPRWPQGEVPIAYVTNGIHTPSWDSAASDALWSKACGKERWLGDLSTIEEDLKEVPDEVLWSLRCEEREQLVRYVRERLVWQQESSGSPGAGPSDAGAALDPKGLIIGFGRRFATYKRPNLLLHDPERLVRLLSSQERPVQLIIAGKAHPRDEAGKALVLAWSDFIRRPEVHGRVFFLADYDMVLAEQMVQGVDLWINTPRRPWEACGTSGMKVLVNGGLHLSELDGWWAEAYSPEVGWALGDGKEHGEDPRWDANEADALYTLLEKEVIPCFYEHDKKGIPARWISRIKKSMAELTPRFSTNRMLREYVEDYYLPAAETYRSRIARNASESKRLCEWQESIQRSWQGLQFLDFRVQEQGNQYTFTAAVELADLVPGTVAVQLYAEPEGHKAQEIHPMAQGNKLPEAKNGYLYLLRIPAQRPAQDYTPRVISAFPGASLPLEENHILWYR